MEELDLGSNQLTGQIPTELGGLSNLEQLDLNDNKLSGQIPTELGNLSDLTEMSLGVNQLSGTIPSELGNLSNLTGLWLEGNQLTGEVPRSFTNLASLSTFYFWDNAGLCAPTDSAFRSWLQAIEHVLGHSCDFAADRAVLVRLYNATDGPNWWYNTNWLSNRPMGSWDGVTTDDEGRVNRLNLEGNQLSGQIPTQIGSLSNLTWVNLAHSQLNGEIPTQ